MLLGHVIHISELAISQKRGAIFYNTILTIVIFLYNILESVK